MSRGTIVLEAFEYVTKDRAAEYEAAAVEIDTRVEETEPGMMVHALTYVSETAESKVYRWLEVFEDVSALKAHFANPAVGAHVEKMNDGILNAPTELIIFGDISEADQAELNGSLSGASMTFCKPVTSFYRAR